MITFPSSLGGPLLNRELIYPCVDAGDANPLPDCTILFPGLPVPSLEPYDLCVDGGGSQAQISQKFWPSSKDPMQKLINLGLDPRESPRLNVYIF